ncbi:MAG: hypothetical protein ACI9H6_000777 [Patiriisocius sp.]|jgi:hypothetical protein
MDNRTEKELVIEHAKLVAAHASGNTEVKERLGEIEKELQLSAPEIAHLAVTEYMRDY